jgi:predicted dinucleotide-binding enzyme
LPVLAVIVAVFAIVAATDSYREVLAQLRRVLDSRILVDATVPTLAAQDLHAADNPVFAVHDGTAKIKLLDERLWFSHRFPVY